MSTKKKPALGALSYLSNMDSRETCCCWSQNFAAILMDDGHEIGPRKRSIASCVISNIEIAAHVCASLPPINKPLWRGACYNRCCLCFGPSYCCRLYRWVSRLNFSVTERRVLAGYVDGLRPPWSGSQLTRIQRHTDTPFEWTVRILGRICKEAIRKNQRIWV